MEFKTYLRNLGELKSCQTKVYTKNLNKVSGSLALFVSFFSSLLDISDLSDSVTLIKLIVFEKCKSYSYMTILVYSNFTL